MRRPSVSVSSANIQMVNAPSGVEPTLATTSLAVSVVGPEAQVTRVTGDSISVQVDLSNFQNQTGTVEVPATVTLTGSLADSCWVVDEYTVSVNIPGVQAAAARTMRTESSEDDVAATPQGSGPHSIVRDSQRSGPFSPGRCFLCKFAGMGV